MHSRRREPHGPKRYPEQERMLADPTPEQQFSDALGAPDAVDSLRRTVETILQGLEPAMSTEDRISVVYDWLAALRRQLHEAGDPHEDAVLDVMDFLVGWCSPQARIRV